MLIHYMYVQVLVRSRDCGYVRVSEGHAAASVRKACARYGYKGNRVYCILRASLPKRTIGQWCVSMDVAQL